MLLLNQIRPMKIIDFESYPDDRVDGWILSFIKLKNRSFVEVMYDEAVYSQLPSFSFQVGPSNLLEITFGFVKFYLSFSLYTKHYDY
jgi:hypothetical protein